MDKVRKTASLFLIALFVSYYAGATLFSHTHIISGITVFHSHLHTDAHHDTKSGGHTENSIILISQISHLDYVNFSCNGILKPLQLPLHEYKFVETTHWITLIHLENLSLRAPPFC